MRFVEKYQQNYHFAVNFYAVFLLISFIPDMLGLPPAPALITYPFGGIKLMLALWIIFKNPIKKHFRYGFHI
jgi:hypothetical protein